MPDRPHERAPRWRRTAAGLVDGAAFGGLWWLARRRELVSDDGPAARLFAVSRELLRQQLRTPGQLLVGTRSVDRRTGARVAPWRTLVLVGVGAAGQELIRRLAPKETPERRRAQRELAAETHEVFRRYPQASTERDEALREVSSRYPRGSVSPSVVRAVGPTLAVGLLNTRLHRRLAPTVEVLAREG
jgi:hypothetical protein